MVFFFYLFLYYCFLNNHNTFLYFEDCILHIFLFSNLLLYQLCILLYHLLYTNHLLFVLNYNYFLREYKYFVSAYPIAIFLPWKNISIFILILIYSLYVYRTILKSRIACCECECEELYFSKLKLNPTFTLIFQLSLSLIILILSSHYFVNEIKLFSNILNISPAILALIITPFATELPEIINSIIWLKQGKDVLAISNILGAIVFQTTILFSLGIFLTSWELTTILYLNIFTSLICAIFLISTILFIKKINRLLLFTCGIFYFAYMFCIYILIK